MSVREKIRAALATSKEPDPTVVARRLALKFTKAEREEALGIGLDYIARNENQLARNRPPSVGAGRSRRAIERERECIAGQWVLLEDCTYELLIALADEYESESQALSAKAVQTREFAAELKASGCATVGEWRKRKAA